MRSYGYSTALCLLAMCAPAAAQVLRVGPGRPFATISAALAAANRNDVVLVDPGTYAPFDIAFPVSVVADTLPFTLQPSASRPALRIANIAAGETVTVAGFDTAVAHGGAACVEIRACAGTVRIQQAKLLPTAALANVPMRAVVDIVDSPSVWLSDLEVWPASPLSATTANSIAAPGGVDAGVSALTAERCTVVLQRVRLRGYDNLGAPTDGRWGGDALRLLGRSAAVLWAGVASGNTLQGGAGGQYGGSAVHLIAASPFLDVSSCGTTRANGGAGPLPGGYFAVNHDRGVVQTGPITIERFVPACLFEAVGEVSAPPRLRPGATHAFGVASFLPRVFSLHLGLTALRSVQLPGVAGTAVLDYLSPTTVTALVGLLPSGSPSQSVAVRVPNSPALVGLQLGTQAVLGPPIGTAGPAWSLSLATWMLVAP
jgi:hypothetical protein